MGKQHAEASNRILQTAKAVDAQRTDLDQKYDIKPDHVLSPHEMDMIQWAMAPRTEAWPAESPKLENFPVPQKWIDAKDVPGATALPAEVARAFTGEGSPNSSLNPIGIFDKDPSGNLGFYDSEHNRVNVNAPSISRLIAGDLRPMGQTEMAKHLDYSNPRRALLSDQVKSDPLFNSRNILTHELGHQWTEKRPAMAPNEYAKYMERIAQLGQQRPDIPFYNSHVFDFNQDALAAPIVARYVEGVKQGAIQPIPDKAPTPPTFLERLQNAFSIPYKVPF